LCPSLCNCWVDHLSALIIKRFSRKLDFSQIAFRARVSPERLQPMKESAKKDVELKRQC
jgi:hypothetical protein